jgi:hypothetical protein
MNYLVEVLVLPEHVSTNKLLLPVKLTAGILKNVSIVFPPGCVRRVRVQVFHGVEQILPLIAGTYYAEDSMKLDLPEYRPFSTGENMFYVMAWQDGCSYKHLVNIMISVQAPEELDVATALKYLADAIVALVEKIRSWW